MCESKKSFTVRCLLAAALLLTLTLLSCSKSTEGAEKAEPRRLTVVLDNILQDWEGQDRFAEEYQKLTGIALEIIQPPHQQYMDKLLIEIASGKLPDACEILPEYLPRLVSDDVLIPLDGYIAEARYLGSLYPQYLEAVRYKDGRIYGIPARDGGGCVSYIRKDWLDKLGLDIPRNWDQLLTVMRAFTFNDPDGNEVQDTFGYTDVLAASQDWYNRLVMLDAHVEIYNEDGMWVDGFSEQPMRAALKRLEQIYREGIIDREFIINTTYTARAKFYNGQAGIFTYWANHWARNLDERTRATQGESAAVVAMPAIQGARYINRIGPLLVITRGAADPQFVFTHFIDRQYDKDAIQTLFTYGVEGYHYSRQDGGVLFLPNPADPLQGHFTKAYVPPVSILNDWDQPMRMDPLVEPALKVLKANPYQETLKSGGPYYAKYYLDIDKKVKPDLIARIITGECTIDQGLEEYREKYSGLVDLILVELNEK